MTEAIWAKALGCCLDCYYDEISGCTDDLWQCQTCKEWFCGFHWHETSLGYCVECGACEHMRLLEEGPR